MRKNNFFPVELVLLISFSTFSLVLPEPICRNFLLTRGYLLLNQQGDKLFNGQAKTRQWRAARQWKGRVRALKKENHHFFMFCFVLFFISHSFSCPQLVRMTLFLLTPSPAEIVAILSSRPSVNTCLNMLQICVHFIQFIHHFRN